MFTGQVEETKNLVALHNLSEDKLLKVISLGGFPMPSIAVTKQYIAKITVEEYFDEGTKEVNRKAYNLQGIKIEPAGGRFIANANTTSMPYTGSTISISDLFSLVKTFDKKFSPKPVNQALLNEDGTPKVFYHGTSKEFWSFDIHKSNDKWKRCKSDRLH